MSSYPIGMWRVPVPQVHKGDYFSLIEDRGELVNAIADSNTNYLFAETVNATGTLATRPLAIIGTLSDIVDFLIKNKNRKIQNRIAELPNIYLGIAPYRPKNRFRGLFPAEDFGNQLFSQLMNFFPDLAGINVPAFVEVAAIPSTLDDLWSAIQRLKERDDANSSGDNMLFVKFSYLPEDNMQHIATGEISLAQVLNVLKVGGARIGTAALKIA